MAAAAAAASETPSEAAPPGELRVFGRAGAGLAQVLGQVGSPLILTGRPPGGAQEVPAKKVTQLQTPLVTNAPLAHVEAEPAWHGALQSDVAGSAGGSAGMPVSGMGTWGSAGMPVSGMGTWKLGNAVMGSPVSGMGSPLSGVVGIGNVSSGIVGIVNPAGNVGILGATGHFWPTWPGV